MAKLAGVKFVAKRKAEPIVGKLAATPYKVPCGNYYHREGGGTIRCVPAQLCAACRAVDRLRSALAEAVHELEAYGVDGDDLASWRSLARR